MYGKLSRQGGQGEYKTYRELFSRIDQLEAWRTILGQPMLQLNQFITSPFRPGDTRPGCFLSQRNGTIFFTDFAYPYYNKYTCCHALSDLAGYDLYESATRLISNQIYNLPLKVHTTNGVVLGDRRIISGTGSGADIHFETFLYDGKPSYTATDKDYWSPRGVTMTDLLNYSQPAYSVHHYYINGQLYYPVTYPCYGLYFPSTGRVKLYMPNSPKERKFISNTSSDDVWRWNSTDPFQDICIITKSFKDGLLLSKAVDYDIWAFQSEAVIPMSVIDQINERYSRKIILYDNDEPGIHHANRLKPLLPGSELMFYPRDMGKDTDDMVLRAGYSFVQTYIQHEISN